MGVDDVLASECDGFLIGKIALEETGHSRVQFCEGRTPRDLLEKFVATHNLAPSWPFKRARKADFEEGRASGRTACEGQRSVIPQPSPRGMVSRPFRPQTLSFVFICVHLRHLWIWCHAWILRASSADDTDGRR